MKKNIFLCVIAVVMVTFTSCKMSIVSEEKMQEDIISSAPLWDDDSVITAFTVKNRETDKKERNDTINVKVEAQSDKVSYVNYYQIEYYLDKKEGWLLSDINEYNEDLWEKTPLSGAEDSQIKDAFTDVCLFRELDECCNCEFTFTITDRNTQLERNTDEIWVEVVAPFEDILVHSKWDLIFAFEKEWTLSEIDYVDDETFSGQCGDNLYWVADENGLTVSGTGEEWDFKSNGSDSFINKYELSVDSLVFENGLTKIGQNAYIGLNINDVQGKLIIPESVEKISETAFKGMKSIKSIDIKGNVNYIGDEAFYNVDKLETVYFYGPAPEHFGNNAISKDVTIYYVPGQAGWENGWKGYKTELWINDELLQDLITRAENGDDEAQFGLAKCYATGVGTEKNLEKAVEWYTKSAENGNCKAQNNLAICYYNGEGVTQNYVEAVKWYTKAAEQGDGSAQNKLGNCYYYGNGVQQDYKKAVELFTKSAEQGYASAQFNLGWCYYNGYGVVQDYTTAVKWFSLSAETNNSGAQCLLGDCYYYGYGVKNDYKEAVKWYEKSAEQGDDYAQYNLGWCYYYGQGVSKNKTKGRELIQKAADAGNEFAIDWLKNN